MWLKLLILIGTSTLVLTFSPPRKLFREISDEDFSSDFSEVPISSFKDPFDDIDYRLPNTTKPLHYDIWLKTDIDQANFTFSGRVTILIDTLESTNEIVLHKRQLTIIDIRLQREAGGQIQANVPFTEKDDVEFLIIRPTQRLIAGLKYRVVINYVGVLRNDDAGFYRSSYLDGSGNRRWLATTQFESTDARHAFPCYDEPAIRSSYSIEIQHASSYNSISNMPEISKIPVEGTNHVTTKFDTIPSVQSYLIAFIVSDFTFAEDLSGKVPQRVFANKQLIDAGQAKLAIDVSRKILEGFESYLETNFSLPKMDQAGLADFAAGAMENWGLVTYRESSLLFNDVTGTTSQRDGIIGTIAHEFAHQWFGNLISPAWWSYLWLNEGFATLYASHILEVVYPGQNYIDSFLVGTVQGVMDVDTNPSIRPMSYYVENPDRIDRLFDNVAYSKSGSVLKMFQNAFGDSTWRKGLKYYLRNRGFNSATPDDLYEGIQEAVNEDNLIINRPDVASIMNTWTTQSGLPFITVSKSGRSLTFEQNRFLLADRDAWSTLWWIPINYVVGSNADFSNTKPDFWLRGVKRVTLQESELPKTFNDDDWIVVNAQQTGYYRVNYDTALWRAIINQLNKEGDTEYKEIHTYNRAQLVDDSFNLARGNVVTYHTTFSILDYLEKETEYAPWYSANRANNLLNRWLQGSSAYSHYQQFMQKNAQKAFLHYGVDIIKDEPRVDRYTRNIVMNIACQAQHPVCLSQTNQRLINLAFENGVELGPDEASSVYCNGIRSADLTLFNVLKSKMILTENANEKNLLMSALGCVQDQNILKEYLNYAITESTLTNAQRSRILTSSVTIGENSIKTLMEFVSNNIATIRSFGLVNTVVSNIAPRISPPLIDEFNAFVDILQSQDALSATQAASHKGSAVVIRNWQTEFLRAIELFFAGEEEPTTTTVTTTTTTTVTTTTTTTPSTTTTTTNQPSTTPSTTTTTLGASNAAVSIFVLLATFTIKFLL